jgi:DNA-binding PadR family transcriptional regulator
VRYGPCVASRQRSNPLALAVLACLVERPMHPYEMAATMRTRGEDESIKLNYGSLYTVVESLARRRLIEPGEPERDGRRPERTVYAITESGRTEFVDWLTELLGTPVKEYPQFEAGLTLMGGLPSADVVPLLEGRAKLLELEIGRLSSMLDVATSDGVPRVFLVEVEYERAQREAELEFTRNLARDIASGSLDGLDQWDAFHAHGDNPASTDDSATPEPSHSDTATEKEKT